MNNLAQIIIDDAKSSVNGIDISKLSSKTLLITGASGLVGTYFIASLPNTLKKTKVFAVCKNKPEKYWLEITKKINCTILKGDLCDSTFIKNLPKADFIIHAAGYGQPGKFMSDSLKTIKLNTSVTLQLLEKLKKNGKFLFISSSEVYSGLDISPFKENQIGTTNTDHPRSCYIEAKRCGEAIVFSARNQGVNAKSARLSLAYGPGTKINDERVLNSFIRRAIIGRKINMLDNGSAIRTYCYITDAIWIMWKILIEGKENIYNVGGKSKTTIAELAKIIGKILVVPVNIPKSKKQTISGSPKDVNLDLNKIKKEFDKKTFVSLESGIEKTISWQKELYL